MLKIMSVIALAAIATTFATKQTWAQYSPSQTQCILKCVKGNEGTTDQCKARCTK